MTETLFGCSFSDVWVSPSDWKTTTSKASLKKNWYVQCQFYDPLFKEDYPKGKTFRKKLNKFKTLEDRKSAAAFYLEEIPRIFKDGYNHITETYMAPELAPAPEPEKLTPATLCVDAIEQVWVKIKDSALQSIPEDERGRAKPFDDVRVAKNRFVKGLNELRYDSTPIKDLSLSQIKDTIAHLKITEGYYNKFLAYMSKIYTELIEYGCVESNPFKLFKKKKPVKKIREVLTYEEFVSVMEFLQRENYGLYRYGMIFHQSGARSTELMNVKAKDVDLENQEYKVLIKKGNCYVEEIKVILLDALPYWREVMSEVTDPEDYIFSKCLRPGEVPIAARQISRKWHKLIKTRYNKDRENKITADFYALKHFFLDWIDAQHFEAVNAPENVAQKLASHRSPTITNSVYLVNKKKREREQLKKIRVKPQASAITKA